ncbi:MAG TPA: hypothetical protein VF765_30950 [Polyangiaceae bacterium]
MIGGYASYMGTDAIRWWPDVDGQEFDGGQDVPRHERLIPAAYLVWMRNASRRQHFYALARAYGGFEESLMMPNGAGIDASESLMGAGGTPYNVIRSGTNTLTAKIIKNRPSPFYLPVGADSRLQERVRLLNRFTPGLLRKVGYYPKRYRKVRNASLFGMGNLFWYRDGQGVGCDVLQPWEINVDPIDARNNDPRSLIIIRYLDKGILKRRFPKSADAIENAPVLDESFQPVADMFAMSNRCTVVEAWHLPSGDARECADGRHSICLLDETLYDRRYNRPEFPITSLCKTPGISGWWGMGVGTEMWGFQDRISMMDERLEYAVRTVGGKMWLVPEGSQIYDTDFNDDMGVIIRHTPGMEPKDIDPQPFHEQLYQYFRDLTPDAYGFSAISQMSAQARKEPGVTAALALQTLDDIETDGFIGFERDDEEGVVEDARQALHIVRQIARNEGDFTVMSAGRGSGEKIDWKRDVDVPEDGYTVQAWAVSLLPKTPAARMQRLLELGANGYFDKPTVLRYLELPDTAQEEQLMLSARAVCDAQLETMIAAEDPFDEASFIAPTEHQDCAYALQRADAHYNRLQTDSIRRKQHTDPKVLKKLENLDKYIQLAKAIDDKAKAEAAAIQAQAAAAAQQQQVAGQPAAQQGAGPAPQLSMGPPPTPSAPIAPAAPLSPA